MSQLALRIWTGTEMIYPLKFSVMFDPEKKKSSVRAFINNEKFITFDYMMITPLMAINGPVFLQDIVIINNDYENFYLVKFDKETCLYYAENICSSEIIILNNSLKLEIAGNIFEDRYLFGETTIEEIEETSDVVKEDVIDKNNVTNKENNLESIIEAESISDKKEETKEDKLEKEQDRESNDINNDFNDAIEEIPAEEIVNINEPVLMHLFAPTNLELEEEFFDEGGLQPYTCEEVTENAESNEQDESDLNQTVLSSIDLLNIDESEYIDTSDSIYVNKSDYIADIDIHVFSIRYGDKGKYAFTFILGDKKDTFKGEEDFFNSNKLDLSAVISALEMLDGKFNVRIYTNSQYVVCPFFKGWIQKWHDSKWYKNSTDMIKNHELWSQIYDFYTKYNIQWEFCETLSEPMIECQAILDESDDEN